MEVTLHFHDPERKPLTLNSSHLMVALRGLDYLGVPPSGGNELVGEHHYGGSELKRMEFSGHPQGPPPESPAEYETVELTEVDIIGPGAAYDAATGQLRDESDLDRIKIRVRKQPEPEKGKT